MAHPLHGGDALRAHREQFFRVEQEAAPFVGQRDFVVRAVEQTHADFILQIPHLPGERGLGKPELGGGFGKAESLGDSDKVTQVAKLHFPQYGGGHSQKLSTFLEIHGRISRKARLEAGKAMPFCYGVPTDEVLVEIPKAPDTRGRVFLSRDRKNSSNAPRHPSLAIIQEGRGFECGTSLPTFPASVRSHRPCARGCTQTMRQVRQNGESMSDKGRDALLGNSPPVSKALTTSRPAGCRCGARRC